MLILCPVHNMSTRTQSDAVVSKYLGIGFKRTPGLSQYKSITIWALILEYWTSQLYCYKYCLYCKLWRFQSICPKVHLSEGSPVRRFICPKVHLSEGSPVRRFTCPKVHLSEGYILFQKWNHKKILVFRSLLLGAPTR